MQDVKLAWGSSSARKLPGMRAVNMTENILGKNLHHQKFWPVWEKCEQYELPLFLKNVDPVPQRLVEDDFSILRTMGNAFAAPIAATAARKDVTVSLPSTEGEHGLRQSRQVGS